MTERHIVAIGGDGLLADDGVFERYVFALTGKPSPRLLYLPTATGDRTESLEAVEERFPGATPLRTRPKGVGKRSNISTQMFGRRSNASAA